MFKSETRRAGLENPAPRKIKAKLVFQGLEGPGEKWIRYPYYMYREDTEPRLIKNEDEEKQARLEGFDNVTASRMSNTVLVNWYWDLEDMSAKQLVVFAKDEYDVDLPIEAGQDKLFKAVIELAKAAPQNRNRLIFMAHTVQMEYDATLAEIKRMVNKPSPEWETQTEHFEVEL